MATTVVLKWRGAAMAVATVASSAILASIAVNSAVNVNHVRCFAALSRGANEFTHLTAQNARDTHKLLRNGHSTYKRANVLGALKNATLITIPVEFKV